MKTLVSLLATALSGLAFAATPTVPGAVPEGLAASEWSDIRAAYEAARHAPQRQDGGHLVARNPGQQWRTEFDGKGFMVTPDHGTWTWGLELTGYGDRKLPSAASFSQLRHEGGKITCQRDENLSEWFINDSRGLEQGWDIRRRPGRADPAAPLQLHLSTRGSVRPQVSDGGDSVSFQQESGGSALTYGGLKAWDADGRKLSVRFEAADGKGIRISVDDQGARYPVTIDPTAQQAHLTAGNAGEGDEFGYAVAISGDTVVIGAPGEDSAATGVNGDQTSNGAINSGAAYVFTRSGTAWTQQAYLKASNTGADDGFGWSVTVSGDTVAVAANGEDSAATGVNDNQTSEAAPNSGAAYVFTRSGTVWTQQAYLKASNTQANDVFGFSMAASDDTLVVGANDEDSDATGMNGNQTSDAAPGSGAAYIFTRSGTTWTQQAYVKASNPGGDVEGVYYAAFGNKFGTSVAISGETVIVGAYGEDSIATGVNGDQTIGGGVFGPMNLGAAYVFTRSGTAWTQQAYLKASNSGGSDWFGYSVGISGDTVVVGAPREASNATGVNGNQANNEMNYAGAAYVFTRSGTTWTQQAYLKASNTGAWDPIGYGEDYFGTSVAVSGDVVIVGAPMESSSAKGVNGNQLAVGAPGSGAAYLFSRTGTTWIQDAYLKAGSTEGYRSERYGNSMAVSGDTALIGAYSQGVSQGGLVYGGAAYVLDITPAPVMWISQQQQNIANGGTKSFGPASMEGGATELTFTMSNTGERDLILPGTPKVTVTGNSDFSVTSEPLSPVGVRGGSTPFKVRFAPTGEGARSATLSIPNNDAKKDPYVIQLTGRGLAFTTDTDGDGLSDASEWNMSALNLDWQVRQPALVGTYFANVNRGGLYDPSQVHALRVGTLSATSDPASGRLKLTTRWKKSANLTDFFDLPAPAGSAVSISPSGDIEFEFPSPDHAEFLRIEPD